MTKTFQRKNNIILAIVPSSRGFGFAALEGRDTLVDWGLSIVTGDKNSGSLKNIEKMIADYRPRVLVLHDASAKGYRKGPRIRKLVTDIVVLAKERTMNVALLSRDQLMQAFFIDGKGTKYTVAQVLAKRFPEELGHRLPLKRKAWSSESHRMAIFEAVAVAFAQRLRAKGL